MIPRRSAVARLGAAALALGVPLDRLSRVQDVAAQESDADIERLLRLSNVPSVSWAVVDGDRITTRSVGIKKAGEAERATADTVYAAASLSKSVFAYVFLSLVQDGVLSLDRPVREYLPLPNPDDARAATITARHLLSHSGGWRNWRNQVSQPLTSDFDPGSRWSYSGEGFFFLQRVAEKVTGKALGVLARERVFEPLGMKRSSFAALAELEPYQATGHDQRGEVGRVFGRPTVLELRRMMTERGLPLDAATTDDSEKAIRTAEPMLQVLPNFLSPNVAGSMLTTANDFGAFARHIVTARKRGGAAAAIVDLMMTPQVRCNEAVQWGLGVGIEEIGSRRLAWQWGDNPGFKNFWFGDPSGGKAMAVFTNGERGARVYERVVRTVGKDDRAAFLLA